MIDNTTIRLLIVDDHPLVREGIRSFLDSKAGLEVIAEAASGEEALRLLSIHKPDIILMDLHMKDMDGIATTRQIVKNYPKIKVVILTSYHDDSYIFPALEAGALSYILKDINPNELEKAIHAAARGEAVLHSQVATRVLRENYGPKNSTPNPFTELTKRELEILKLIAQGQSNSTIANNLAISEGTVKGHVSNLLSKLGLRDRTQAAAFAWQQGVVRRE